MRRLTLVLALLAATSLHAQTKAPTFTGFLSLRGVNGSGPESWIAGGFGRMEVGADRTELLATAQVGADWEPVQWFDVHVSGIARREPSDYEGKAAGLIDAYADLRAVFTNDQIQLRAGQFFLPTSRENKGDLWTSPYTISFSAINSWIGEEVRPVGADLEWKHTTGPGHVITAAASAFRNNDTMGTLLAWRGWSVGNRLTVYNEELPLPPLATLPRWFPKQRDGTIPFESDLDGHTGWSARVRYSLPERANIQVMRLDNGGDKGLYRSEYSWDTKFTLVSAELGNTDKAILAAEYITGKTAMGWTAPNWVIDDFDAWYLLASQKLGRFRWSARYEEFAVDEYSRGKGSEDGQSWTITGMYELTPSLRGAAEFTQVSGNKESAREAGFSPSTDGRNWSLELRYRF
ncbi:MAG TPA: hypothetical protein VFN10_07735 [Thermoanaerobaculia bacterium]|nr:hypothetical protein [Thermoanaerobaculia bacterium]